MIRFCRRCRETARSYGGRGGENAGRGDRSASAPAAGSDEGRAEERCGNEVSEMQSECEDPRGYTSATTTITQARSTATIVSAWVEISRSNIVVPSFHRVRRSPPA